MSSWWWPHSSVISSSVVGWTRACTTAPLARVQVGLLAHAADDLVVELLEHREHDAVRLLHLVVEPEVLVGVGGVHDVAEPVDVVAVVAGLARVGRRDVAAVELAQVLEVLVGEPDLPIERQIAEAGQVGRRVLHLLHYPPLAARPQAGTLRGFRGRCSLRARWSCKLHLVRRHRGRRRPLGLRHGHGAGRRRPHASSSSRRAAGRTRASTASSSTRTASTCSTSAASSAPLHAAGGADVRGFAVRPSRRTADDAPALPRDPGLAAVRLRHRSPRSRRHACASRCWRSPGIELRLGERVIDLVRDQERVVGVMTADGPALRASW